MPKQELPLDVPKLAGYLLGAGTIVWLVTGWWTPLVVGGISVAVLRKTLQGLK